MSCPFRLAVINDEISQDFDHACYVAAHDFGLQWIELRGMWNKNISELDSAQVDESRQILVPDNATPLFTVNWPGAPQSKEGPQRDQFHADFDFKQQDALLARCIDLARAFRTDRIRCFDFWRLEDQKSYRAAINEKLREAARTCAKSNMILLLENEMACNTGSGPEAIETLKAVPETNFMLNWDPGNSATFAADKPYPDDYNRMPRNRIGHCHAKDTIVKPGGKFEWAPVGGGVIDWVGQFKALIRDGFRFGVSLETHWHGGKPDPGSSMSVSEASTRASMKGLKEALAKAGAGC